MMQISFFEEFPTKKNLAKIKYVPFPTKIYVAAHSLHEFKSISLPSKNIKERIYWPLLKREEGYWFSPFSQRKALLRIMKELQGKDIPLLWDAELPTHTNPLLYLTQSIVFFQNRKLIRDFVSDRKEIYTAEYFPSSRFAEGLLHFLGLSFTKRNHYPIKMVYSSMHDFGEEFIRREVVQAQKRYGKRLRIGLGTLTHGIRGDEPIISLSLLERDMNLCKELGIEEVILFRLGGMNKDYQGILEKFIPKFV